MENSIHGIRNELSRIVDHSSNRLKCLGYWPSRWLGCYVIGFVWHGDIGQIKTGRHDAIKSKRKENNVCVCVLTIRKSNNSARTAFLSILFIQIERENRNSITWIVQSTTSQSQYPTTTARAHKATVPKWHLQQGYIFDYRCQITKDLWAKEILDWAGELAFEIPYCTGLFNWIRGIFNW